MPVSCTFAEEGQIIGFDFQGLITVDEFQKAVAEIPATDSDVDHICRFHRNTDLSALTLHELKDINQCIKDRYTEIGLVRRKDACVLDGSVDAKLVMPLWRAVCNHDPDVGVDVAFFPTSEEAAKWLGVDPEIIQRIMPDD